MASHYYDNEPSIVVHAFNEVRIAVEAKYGKISEARVREMLFIVMRDESSASFTTALSRAKTVAKVPEMERSKYHSFGVRYFQHPDVKKSRKSKKQPKKDTTNWRQISILCAREQFARNAETGEDRLDPDWTPDYEGPIWED